MFMVNSALASVTDEITQSKSSPQLSSLDQFIANRINVSESKTIFTLFAMLNVAGYDEENNKEGMHLVRVKVRERLSEVTPQQLKERLRKFYRAHQSQSTNHTYAVVATLTSGAPDFSFTKEWKDIENTPPYNQLKDLPGLLREFYLAVPIDVLYEEVRPEYLSFINDYRKVINKEVSKVMSYCRVKDVKQLRGGGETKYATVIPNLLESYERASSFALDAGFYSIDGPQKRMGYNPHEFIHSITNPLSYNPRYRKRLQRSQPLLDAARELPFIQKKYKTIEGFFDECLVRAISLKYLDTGDAKRAAILHSAMTDEYKSGYILERFFYEQLGEYEKSKKSLQEYYPLMLKHLDVEKEINRWRQDIK
jgi:hypothetical protein